jgi:hypothetical protein
VIHAYFGCGRPERARPEIVAAANSRLDGGRALWMAAVQRAVQSLQLARPAE